MNSDASRNPPARAMASRSPIAQRCSSSTSSPAGVLGDLGQHVPGLLLVEHPAALGPDLEPFLAGRAQADQPVHQGAERGLLVGAELALVQDLDLAVGVLADGQGVDHPDQVVVAEPVQLGADLAVQVGLLEAQHQQLHRSYAVSASPLGCWVVACWLLPGHVHPQLGFGVLDQLAADIHGHGVDGAGELERTRVVGGDR